MESVISTRPRQTRCETWLDGQDVAQLSQSALARVRGRRIGFVFQTFELLPRQTAVRNVELPLIYSGTPGRRQRAIEALRRVGLQDRMTHRPNQMSGGQRQRVAIARALVTEPACVLADEPTGNLDLENGERVFDLLLQATRERSASLVLVTHDRQLAARCDRTLTLVKGVLQALPAHRVPELSAPIAAAAVLQGIPIAP